MESAEPSEVPLAGPKLQGGFCLLFLPAKKSKRGKVDKLDKMSPEFREEIQGHE